MSGLISIRFYGELNDFLPPELRKISFRQALKKARSVKDLIESIGIPHTEIDLIVINGESVDFSHAVKTGEQISVYPAFRSVDISPLKHCQPEPLGESRFVVDAHLGRLAAYLRMLGFDTLYRNDYDDLTLADTSASEQRILLTCDRLLLMRKQVTYGYFVRSRLPAQQLPEIMSRFDLHDQQKPFKRCMHCNGLTHRVNKKDIETQLLPKTKMYYDKFFQCRACNKIYWRGSHYLKMKDMIDKINAEKEFCSSPDTLQ